MTAMHPDSGVPPEDARNSLPNDIELSQNCNELWYSTSRCEPRFDPAAANAMLAELINLINRGEVVYDCHFLEQVELAVRYIVQRGLPMGSPATMGPTNYLATLDPPLTRYNDFLVLCVVPTDYDNTTPITINVNGRGPVPVLRDDGKPLVKGDWVVNRPYLIGYWAGNFYVLRKVASQIPQVLTDDIDGWVRTDGNDLTGDGTTNTPEKAFQTIQGCWAEFSRRYMPSPFHTIHIRLGIPGTYKGAAFGPFGSRVALHGDVGSSSAYRITTNAAGSNCFNFYNIPFFLEGVTLTNDMSSADPIHLHVTGGSDVLIRTVGFEAAGNSGRGAWMHVSYASSLGLSGNINLVGNGAAVVSGFQMYQLATVYWIAGAVAMVNSNTAYSSGFVTADRLSSYSAEATGSLSYSGCTGPKYWISGNSVVNAYGKDFPGSAAGPVTYGGQYIP